MSYREIKNCRCCGAADLLPYLDLGSQPPANSYHRGEKLPSYPLELAVCMRCFHSQLTVVVDPRLLFTHYLYVSGTTDTLRGHFQRLAKDVLSRIDRQRPRVLDIACNDGTLLECFREAGATVAGVDPAINLREVTSEKGIDVTPEFWSEEIAAAMDPVDVICGTNVFAHVDDVRGFLLACRKCLRRGGLIALEFPYCRRMILSTEFDTIYHEHLSYFLIGPAAGLARRLGFQVEDLSFWPIHGGSVRLILRDSQGDVGASVRTALSQEAEDGFNAAAPYQAFAKRVEATRGRLLALLDELGRGQRRLIGYGASAKGNTMLNYCRPDLPYIVDDNPLKWGLLTPGRNIPIKPPEALCDEKDALHLLLLAWNFSDEIVRRVKKLRPRGGDYAVRYIPEVDCHEIDSDRAHLE